MPDVQTPDQLTIPGTPPAGDSGAIPAQDDSTDNTATNTNDGGGGNDDTRPSTPDESGSPSPDSSDGSSEHDSDGHSDDDSSASSQSLEYTLETIDDSLLAPTRVAEIESFAKENGLPQDAAQAMLKQESESVDALRDALVEQQKEMTAMWLKEVKTDKEIGGPKFDESVTLAKQAVEKFGTPELKHYLDATGLGNNVEMVRLFTKLGKAIANDSFVLGGNGNLAKEKTNAEVFYPESAA